MVARFVTVLLVVCFCGTPGLGQWQKVASYNVGINGRMAFHQNAVFLYGNQGGYKLHRSVTNGDTWEDITTAASAQFSDIYSFGGRLFAVYLSTVYVSDDLGTSWSPLSTVTVTGNGALIGLTADGSTLYAFSNRKSVFRSTTNGTSWQELLIDNPNNLTIMDCSAEGDRLLAVVAGSGGWLSTNGGVNWVATNPTEGALIGTFTRNGSLFGQIFVGGVARMASGSSTWVSSSAGLPAVGAFVASVKSPVSRDNVLYGTFSILIANQTGVVQSTTDGASWTMVDTTSLPGLNAAGSSRHVAVTSSHLFVYYYSLSNPSAIGVHRLARSATSAGLPDETVPLMVRLEQNYPNPFNPTTTIRYALPVDARVTLEVFDMLGRRVALLADETHPAGHYDVRFDAGELASGIYFYRLNVRGSDGGSVTRVRKLMLMR